MRDSARRGFTLMELLTVMIIMALMMSIAGVSFFKARQGAEMRGAKRAVQTTISLARQQAVVKRTRTRMRFVNPVPVNSENTGNSGCMILETVRSSTNAVHETKYLPPLITFDPLPGDVWFETDGSAGSGLLSITLNQQGVTPNTTLKFNRLIGAMTEE